MDTENLIGQDQCLVCRVLMVFVRIEATSVLSTLPSFLGSPLSMYETCLGGQCLAYWIRSY